MKHHCHWDGCKISVPPKMWGCKKHWFTLPKLLRAKVWTYYVPGQEITKIPSREYLAVVHAIDCWVKNYTAATTEAEKTALRKFSVCSLLLAEGAEKYGVTL